MKKIHEVNLTFLIIDFNDLVSFYCFRTFCRRIFLSFFKFNCRFFRSKISKLEYFFILFYFILF